MGLLRPALPGDGAVGSCDDGPSRQTANPRKWGWQARSLPALRRRAWRNWKPVGRAGEETVLGVPSPVRIHPKMAELYHGGIGALLAGLTEPTEG